MVSGTVTSSDDGLGLPGVIVSVANSGGGTVTDMDGRYQLMMTPSAISSDSLIFSFIGYNRIVVPIYSRTNIDVVMRPASIELKEAIVTAIGIRKEKKKLGYSATELTGDELQKSGESNLVNALNGKVAGVQVTSSSGSPGSSSSIVIRGYSSIDGSNQPLFVIDGIPIDNSYRGSNFTDQANRAIDINPDDIENITVLKGGAATALYGYKAGNGVVMITTKKGKSGRSLLSYSSTLSFDRVNKLPQKQTIWSQGSGGEYSPGSQLSWGERITGSAFPDQDQDFFATGVTWNHNVSLEGGTDFSGYHLSLGNTNQSGIIPNTDFKRTTIKLNARHKLWDNVEVSGLANYISSSANRSQRGSNLSGVMLGLMRGPVDYELANGSDDPVNDESAYINPDGTQRTFFANYDNPYWSVNKNQNINNVDRIIGAVELNYRINKHWSILNRSGLDFYSDRIKETWDKQSNEYKDLGGRIFDNDVAYRALNNDLVVNYARDFKEKLEVSALVGHNVYDEEQTSYSLDGVGFVIDDFYDISNVPVADLIVDDSRRHIRTVSVYANANFGWNRFLYLDLTARNDWYSTLPAKNNTLFYPSASVSWIFTQNFKLFKALDFGKLRLSAAGMGNGAPAPYLTQPYFQASSSQPQGQLSYEPSSFVFNPELKPERLKSIEAGMDLRFWKNRVGLDITYYNNNSIDQIIYVPVPASSGYLETVINAGNIRNQGWEILVNAVVVENEKSKFNYNTSINFTRNRSEVESLSEGTDLIALPSFGLASTQSVVAVGEPFGVLYGGAWARDSQGNILVNDQGYPIKSDERKVIGDPNPDFLLGWRNDLSWKGFTLSMLWDVRIGGMMHNGTKAVMLYHGTHEDTENRDEQSVVWNGVYASNGEQNITPIFLDEDFYNLYSLQYVSEEVLEEVNWLRLRDCGVTYSFNENVCRKVHVKNLSLSVNSRNMLLFTGYSGIDPETNLSGASNSIGRDYFNSPNTKSLTFTIKASI